MLHTKACEECGKEITWRRNRPRKFCSAQCAHKFNGRAKRSSVEVTCAYCGTLFCKRPAQLKYTTKHFCNMTCMGKWQTENWNGKDNPNYNSVDCTCAICGKEFVRAPCDIRTVAGNFCSSKCSAAWKSQNRSGVNSPYWQGGKVDYRGPNWSQQRDKARERDKYRCRRCKVHETQLSYTLTVHHIIPFRSFGIDRYEEANQLTNLICLCRACHGYIEKSKTPVQLGLL
jgi:hypothetical protein